ncbi:hypothetical protein PUV52_09215 [Leuconostoc mesenteroides]|uniref:Uncharacterized protein n=1 Tax=Leuconostoc mesenteroides subsp. mesenteroides (strain ATCC 8293 / DSM 20343 / BCRC 11652 / CCM 1803 / JCM 6124 / NCDO 523 / NBRC 100496 / NCIMB 8023 / NCTC 12954 / NRRL B-1118 / 37Y) TaxID=203120 RepID=Q03VK7_LEUMM|nr:hypothetical protein [Leuconostoc mesenteroides]ABJ62765.1 hypothetical protein LEUM_1673 [Leuconostoc mesenteroides subsp. mesenteroides ATCC 8293]MCT3042555.1 hypothetical protein [Leuconostoc mesenteroides]MDG9747582.1 hypothetical protein [Leuconostoc mesenteroides]QQB30473.1 hypothetical protein I6H90_06405 [Leuconostoc mesenteroides]SPE14650.1 hypothetical protein LEM9268_01498 [Leuconostoc mesenteroides]
MGEPKTVMPLISFENGVAQNWNDLRATLDGVEVTTISSKVDAQSMAALKKDMKQVSDLIKKSVKQNVKDYEQELTERNGGLFAVKDTADSIIEDITEEQNTWNVGRLKQLQPVLQKEIDERNESYQLKTPLTIKADWLKISNFTATGKPTGALTKLLNLEFVQAKALESEPPKLTEVQEVKKAIKYEFSKVWDDIQDDDIYTGKDFKQMLSEIAKQLN